MKKFEGFLVKEDDILKAGLANRVLFAWACFDLKTAYDICKGLGTFKPLPGCSYVDLLDKIDFIDLYSMRQELHMTNEGSSEQTVETDVAYYTDCKGNVFIIYRIITDGNDDAYPWVFALNRNDEGEDGIILQQFLKGLSL